MKVVLDTNIIISGLYSKRGASYQLLRAAISGELKERIRKAVSREEALRLLDAIVPDVPALPQDELPSDHI